MTTARSHKNPSPMGGAYDGRRQPAQPKLTQPMSHVATSAPMITARAGFEPPPSWYTDHHGQRLQPARSWLQPSRRKQSESYRPLPEYVDASRIQMPNDGSRGVRSSAELILGLCRSMVCIESRRAIRGTPCTLVYAKALMFFQPGRI